MAANSLMEKENTAAAAVGENWRRALIVINPVAGDGRSLSALPGLVKSLTENGIVCTTVTTTGRGIAAEYVKKLGKGCDMVICAGGDGTANEVISGLMAIEERMRPKFAYIPAGSTNDFAAALGLSKRLNENIATIAEGSSVPVDVGKFNDRYYAYICAFGAFTDISHSTSQTAKNLFGPLAYFAKSIETIKNINPIRVRFLINGEVIEDDFSFCAISNSHIIGGVIKMKQELVEMNDGMFEIILIKYPKDAIALSKIITALASGEMKSEYIRFFRSSEVKLEILDEKPVDFSLDGELEKNVRSAHIVNIRSGIRVVKGENTNSRRYRRKKDGEQ